LLRMRSLLSSMLDSQQLRISKTELDDEVMKNLEELGYVD